GRFGPPEVPQHHFARQHDRAGIHLVEAGVLRRGAVGGFEYGAPLQVFDVAAGRDADAADLRRERIRQVVAVQVRRGDDVELVGSRQHLLQRDVGARARDYETGDTLAL